MEINKNTVDNVGRAVMLGTLGYYAWKLILKPITDTAELNRDLQKRKESAKNYTYRLKTKSGGHITINLETIAADINEALNGNRFVEDEERAIRAIGQVPSENPNLILILASLYKTTYGKELKEDLIKFLSSSQWNRIAFKFKAV